MQNKKMWPMLPLLTMLCSSSVFAMSEQAKPKPQATKPNVLFFLIDDMRVNYGQYSKNGPLTPNIDKLAQQGVAFNRAYSNVPVCGASRVSMLTGLWPTKDRFLAFNSSDKDAPGVTSMPMHFKNNGYKTISLGKVFNNQFDAKDSWSELPWRPSDKVKNLEKLSKREMLKIRGDYQTSHAQQAFAQADRNGLAYEAADVSDFTYSNGKVAERAMLELEQFKQNNEAFFLAVGLKKPHLPFNSPQKYWDMYKRTDLRLATNPKMAINAPKAASHNWAELRNYYDIPSKGAIDDDKALSLIHGYYAATSYSDALVGMVLAKLKALDLDENTIVVLWGDHGWSLGEHGLWAKHSSFNVANQIPLIIKAPQMSSGKNTNGLTESVDIYPTLTELANLPKMKHNQGSSLVTLLKSPETSGKAAIFPRWKNADSIRTDRYYYTEWRNKLGKVTARMLYDHVNDPAELVNIAEQPEKIEIVNKLHQQLQTHIAQF